MKCQVCPRKAVKLVESTTDETQKSAACAEHLYATIRIYSASDHRFTTRKA